MLPSVCMVSGGLLSATGLNRERVCIVTVDFPIIGGMRTLIGSLLRVLSERSDPIVLARKWGSSGFRHFDLSFSVGSREWFSPWSLPSLALLEVSGFLWCLLLRVRGVRRFLVQDAVFSGLFAGTACLISGGKFYLFDHGSAVNIDNGLIEQEMRRSGSRSAEIRLYLRIMRTVRWFSLRSCSYFFVHSEGMREVALANGMTRERVIEYSSPIDLEIFRRHDRKLRERSLEKFGVKDSFNILFVGRFTLDKGLGSIVQVFSQLSREFPKRTRLLVVGGGPEEVPFRRMIQQDGLEGVLFFGSAENPEKIAEFMNVASVFFYPIEFGPGVALSVLEAMACELPVVVSSVGRTREFIEDGKNGFVIHPGDTEEAVRVIRGLFTNSPLGRSIGQRARETVSENFSFDAYRSVVLDRVFAG